MVLCPQLPPQSPRGLHCSSAIHNSDSSLVPRPPEPLRQPTKALAPHEELFRQAPDGARDKASFVRAVQNFGQHNVHKRGHVDFIYLALRKMKEYGVERDLAVYNMLLDIFPKEVFRPRSVFQKIFIHYPRQQECGIAVLEQMENHGEASRLGAEEWLSPPPCQGPSIAPWLCLLSVCLAYSPSPFLNLSFCLLYLFLSPSVFSFKFSWIPSSLSAINSLTSILPVSGSSHLALP